MKENNQNRLAIYLILLQVIIVVGYIPIMLFNGFLNEWTAIAFPFLILAVLIASLPMSHFIFSNESPLNKRKKFLCGIKSICLSNGYTIDNWDCGVHDWDEWFDIGYRDPQNAFDDALQCE